MTVALVRFSGHVAHVALGAHPERPERVMGIDKSLATSGLVFEELTTREATDAELLTVHTPEVLATIANLADAGGGSIDGDTYVRKASNSIARYAAGSVIALVQHLNDSSTKRGLAIVRPPGHHATAERSMGFCLFNNVAVAARVGGKRTLIIDWDVHHGNGTQDIFYADGSVAYFSVHQTPLYPGTGHAAERGSGAGKGFNLNVPVPAGSGDAVFSKAVEQALGAFYDTIDPELVIVSAGFDAHIRDPLASCEVTTQGYRRMAERILERAGETPVAFVLEGGYDVEALAESVLEVARACFAGFV
ncbi:MAG: histone deacetylase [Clostridia bacterium]|nr:histone deacetylase [Deltaproteobacteria bacterium]